MNRRSLLTFVVSFACSSVSWSAPATEAEQFLKQAVDEVLAVSDRASNPSALADKVRPILQRYISFETMARRAVGPGWRQFAPDQQKKVTQLFTTLVIRSYSSKFTPGERPVMSYQAAVTPAAGRVDVPTKLVYQGSRYSVTYRLEQEGSWKITDVVIEGVSLIANYRTQLDAKFKAGGSPAVITSLEQSVSRPK